MSKIYAAINRICYVAYNLMSWEKILKIHYVVAYYSTFVVGRISVFGPQALEGLTAPLINDTVILLNN